MVESTRMRLSLLILLGFTAFVFSGLHGAGFVWDDYALVRDNAYTGDFANWRVFFTTDLWETTRLPSPPSGYYRPLFLLSLAVDRALFGLEAGGHHLHSILWHLGCVLLLFSLVRRIFNANVALIAAILFALHPVQHETVALLAARNDSMAAFFTLATLLIFTEKEVGRGRLLAGGGLFFLALLSKESAILAPFLLAVLDWSRWGKLGQRRRYAVLLMGIVALVMLRSAVEVSSAAWPEGAAWHKVLGLSPAIVGSYLGMIFWPWPLTPARHIDYLQPLSALWPFLLCGLGAFFLLVHKGKERGLVWAGLIWALVTFAPSLLATLDKGTVGERYLYLPMAGLSLAIAAAIPYSKRLLFGVGMLGLLGGGAIFHRNADWQSSTTLWQAAYDARPSAYTAGGLAWYVENDKGHLPGIEKNLESARRLYLEALEGEPPYREACVSLLMIHLKLNRPESAARLAEWAHRERGCPLSTMYVDQYLLGLARSGQWEKAEREIARRPKGVTGIGMTVLAGHAAKRRDVEGVRKLLNQWKEPTPLVPQAMRLLRLSGDPQSAEWLRVGATPP
jgi:4-amino-4-deoxy-L-arabinose transferase-like glycosyltransferase